MSSISVNTSGSNIWICVWQSADKPYARRRRGFLWENKAIVSSEVCNNSRHDLCVLSTLGIRLMGRPYIGLCGYIFDNHLWLVYPCLLFLCRLTCLNAGLYLTVLGMSLLKHLKSRLNSDNKTPFVSRCGSTSWSQAVTRPWIGPCCKMWVLISPLFLASLQCLQRFERRPGASIQPETIGIWQLAILDQLSLVGRKWTFRSTKTASNHAFSEQHIFPCAVAELDHVLQTNIQCIFQCGLDLNWRTPQIWPIWRLVWRATGNSHLWLARTRHVLYLTLVYRSFAQI